ncbi:MAG: glutamate synthase subunit alpha, partial [Sphingobacterium sp.]
MINERLPEQGLYNPDFEHDACGVGFVAHIKGKKSHQQVKDALTMLENMEHRGACGCDPESGDGAGIMIQVPHEFLWEECINLGIQLEEPGYYGTGMLFLPKEEEINTICRDLIIRATEDRGMKFLGFRDVPVNREGIGVTALSAEPEIVQFFVSRPDGVSTTEDFERKLFVLRRLIIQKIKEQQEYPLPLYIASLSCKTIIYKGQLTTYQVGSYFEDLKDPRVISAFGLVHSRFSTNTFPSWSLAQPFRNIAHNGEINTLTGNLNWFYAGARSLSSPHFSEEEMEILLPVVDRGQSDSACLDNVVELLLHTGRSLPHVMLMLVPEAWDGNTQMDPLKKAFYEYHATLMEPWDGPAALCFTDGKLIGATLDRNGLRPLRYAVTSDERVVVASEAGALPIPESIIIKKGRQQPGKIFVVDMEQGCIRSDEEIKDELISHQPYGDWIDRYKIRMDELEKPR